MPLEFALRPRIRLTDGFAPPRRSRFRLPKLALPVLMYWLTAGGITYALIHWHDQPESAPDAQSAAVAAQNPEPAWWQPQIAPAALPTATTTITTAATSEPAPALAAALPATADPTPTVAEPALAADEPEPAADAPSPARRHERTEDAPLAPLSSARARHRRERPADDSPASSNSFGTGDAISALALPPLEAPSPEPAPAPDAPSAARSLLSCEAAAASENHAIDLAHPDHSPDLSREAIAAVLDNGVWIARCDIPMSTSIELCVAIQGGVVIGASVSSHPANAVINACLKRRAAGLHFPYSSRVDVAKTRF
jgi:hypothetical protein